MNSIEWFIVIFGSCAIACVLLDILVIKISDYLFDKEKRNKAYKQINETALITFHQFSAEGEGFFCVILRKIQHNKEGLIVQKHYHKLT